MPNTRTPFFSKPNCSLGFGFSLTWHIPTSTATMVRQYKDSSVMDATWMATACILGSGELINTKKTIRLMMVTTMTKMPVNSPVLAWVQSTE